MRRWNGWGDDTVDYPLPDNAADFLVPRLGPGASGLTKPSYALVEQIRSIDKRRVRRVYGTITREELAAIDEGLGSYLGLL